MFNAKAKMFNSRALEHSAEIIESLDIQPGNTIADLGSGGGYYTYEFARLVGTEGRVYAVDTDDSLLAYVKKSAAKRKLENLEAVTATEKSSNLPDNSCDLIFLRNVFHHIKEPTAYFKRLGKAIKPGGSIAIVEWTPDASPHGHAVNSQQIIKIMQDAGYNLYHKFEFLKKQSFQIFKTTI